MMLHIDQKNPVIPAQAGIQVSMAGKLEWKYNPRPVCHDDKRARSGFFGSSGIWIPACAGMTGLLDRDGYPVAWVEQTGARA